MNEFIFLTKAAGTTVSLAVYSLFFGLILAFIFTAWESSRFKLFALLGSLTVTVLRGLPEILIVLFVYFGMLISLSFFADGFVLNLYFLEIPVQFELRDNPFIGGVIALTLLYAAYASQTLRGAIKAVPYGQNEAGQALGMSKFAIFSRLIMPQMWRHALPGLGNQWLVLLKDTALISLISVNDLMMQTKSIVFYTRSPFTWYLIAAAMYLAISLISQYILKFIERKVTPYSKETH